MADLSIDEIKAQLAEAELKNTALSNRNAELETTSEKLAVANNALASQNKTLQAGLGLAGAKAGLPTEVLDDIERRRAMGASDEHATEAAIRQHQHNLRLAEERKKKAADAAKKKADEAATAAAPAPARALRPDEDPEHPGQQRQQRPDGQPLRATGPQGQPVPPKPNK